MTNRPSITQENILLGAEKAAENIIYFDKVEANITKLTNELVGRHCWLTQQCEACTRRPLLSEPAVAPD